jgi:hypothetical protein
LIDLYLSQSRWKNGEKARIHWKPDAASELWFPKEVSYKIVQECMHLDYLGKK